MTAHRLRPLALSLLLLAACSASAPEGGASDGGGGVTPVTADQACADVAKARCERMASCAAADLQESFGTQEACETREKLSCLAGQGAHGTSATPAKSAACASAIGKLSCADYLTGGTGRITDCQPAAGALPAAAACSASAQCSSAYCGFAHGVQCGSCQTAPGEGESCAALSCARGLTCPSDTKICVAPAPANASCDKAHPCAAGLSCVGDQNGATGICRPLGATVGAACDQKRETAPACDARLGLFCSSATNGCAQVTYAQAGGVCGVVNRTLVECTAGATCVLAPGSKQGLCRAPAADGAACDAQLGPDCLFPARCILTTPGSSAGVCTLPDPTKC